MEDTENVEAEIQAMFGLTEETNASTDPSATDASNNATPQENTSAGSAETAAPQTPAPETTPTPQTPTEDTLPDPEEKFSKQNSAFAQMRIQNKELSTLLMDLAKATGQTPKNIAEAQEILKGGLTKVVSKNRNIPEDVLREMEEDKKALAEYKQSQARRQALAGFQKVKDMHGLSREDINTFADKLIEHNLNPFEQNIDLVKEYRNLYYDDLIAKAREEGVQAERARSLKAQQNSTTPSTNKGLPPDTGTQDSPIKTVAELDKLLDSLK